MGIIKALNLIYNYVTQDDETEEEVVVRAIDDVSLDINAGEFIAVLGHNGYGKLDLTPLISHEFSYKEIPEAYAKYVCPQVNPDMTGGLICWED